MRLEGTQSAQTTNFASAAAGQQNQVTNLPNSSIEKRDLAESLAQTPNPITALTPTDPTQPSLNLVRLWKNLLETFNSAASKTLRLFAFGTASLATVSFLLFNFKVLSLIFAAPAVAAFYFSYLSQQRVKDSGYSGMDELNILKQATNNVADPTLNPTYAESDAKLTEALNAVRRVGDWDDENSRKPWGIALIRDFKEVLKAKLEALDKNSSQDSAKIQDYQGGIDDCERALNSYSPINQQE